LGGRLRRLAGDRCRSVLVNGQTDKRKGDGHENRGQKDQDVVDRRLHVNLGFLFLLRLPLFDGRGRGSFGGGRTGLGGLSLHLGFGLRRFFFLVLLRVFGSGLGIVIGSLW
jgi:hypothetical protein